MHTKSTRGFAAPTLKVILAVVFAAGGIGWAGYSVMGGKSGVKKKPAERVITTAMDEEGNAVDPNYSKAKSTKQVDAVADDIQARVADLGKTVGAIKTASSASGNEEVAQATIQALIPIISGDHDGFLAAIEAMGGKITDLDGEHPLFTHLAKVFKHASVDVDRITVAKYEPPNRGGGMMMRREVADEEDSAGDENGPSQSMRESVMMLRPQSLFPDAPGAEDPSAIEVRIPMKPKGDDAESIFSLVLTWNKDARKWQPATYGVVKRELTVEDG